MVQTPHLAKLMLRNVEEEDDGHVGGDASPLRKRSRLAPALQQLQGQFGSEKWYGVKLQGTSQWCTGASVAPLQPPQYDLIDEPSPLGLRLKKSPSLVDMIQMKLAQAGKMKDTQSVGNLAASEKLKASNFHASLLRIGAWEWISRYEGDLVAKCYFAKHKLVWEILDGGLKSKIEMQWSDISALKVSCPENEPGTLEIVLSKRPYFFKEINPEPRKHTSWKGSSDFTGGQASMHRRHFLQCPPGIMDKHIEKLVSCDPHLYSISQQDDINLANPYFEPRCSLFEDLEDSKCRDFDHNDDDCQIASQRFQHLLSPHSVFGRTNTEARRHNGASDAMPHDFNSSVADTYVIKDFFCGEPKPQKDIFDWNTFKVPSIRHSTPKREMMNHIGHHIYKQIYSGNPPGNGYQSLKQKTFEELTWYLLHDTQIMDATDEKMLMTRVKSLCCLLERDSTPERLEMNNAHAASSVETMPVLHVSPIGGDCADRSSPLMQVGITQRQESMEELLMHLPSISSFPHLL